LFLLFSFGWLIHKLKFVLFTLSQHGSKFALRRQRQLVFCLIAKQGCLQPDKSEPFEVFIASSVVLVWIAFCGSGLAAGIAIFFAPAATLEPHYLQECGTCCEESFLLN
jgi:hypothetical protein